MGLKVIEHNIICFFPKDVIYAEPNGTVSYVNPKEAKRRKDRVYL